MEESGYAFANSTSYGLYSKVTMWKHFVCLSQGIMLINFEF